MATDPVRDRARARTCPTCGAEPGMGCVSTSGNPTDLHHARLLGVPMVRKQGDRLKGRRPR